VIAALLAGPSRPAVAVRRVVNTVLAAAARALSHAGSWVAPTGRALAGARPVVQIVVVIAAVTGQILAQRPGIGSGLAAALMVLVELSARSCTSGGWIPEQPSCAAVLG
jgi:hypothetical protein